jgi:hypothetical protein
MYRCLYPRLWPIRGEYLHASVVLVLAAAVVCCSQSAAYPWGGEHSHITDVAITALPSEEQEYLRPERSILVECYCTFPDINWPCFGQWGSGTGDPRAPRMPDTRRLWEISFYTGWDPVLKKGKGYSHAPPQSCEAAEVSFLRAAQAFQDGRLEDGCRYLGVMLHYIQDTGSMPHVQPIHRNFHVKAIEAIRLEGYAPRLLGKTSDEASQSLRARVQELPKWTEQRLACLFESVGMPLEDAKRLSAQQLMAPAVVEAVTRLRTEKPAEFDAAAADCANECARVCADAIHSALAFAQKPYVPPEPNPVDVNLVFNPSLENGEDDAAPAGWVVNWLDVLDRAGRAEWYRARTHWENHVHTGNRSLLILWPPKKGLQWQQTWPKAIRVRPGEEYHGSVWGKAIATEGPCYLALEFADTDYRPLLVAKSDPLATSGQWQRLSVEASVPEKARWLRVILHAEGDQGAVWYDDVEVRKTGQRF